MDKEFEVFINGQLINMIKAGYLESTLRSVPENKSLLIDIWNVVDNSVRNLIKNGLYKDTTLEKAIIHLIDFKKTLTNLHNEFDLDTLFKIVDAIVETSTPTITIPSGIRQPSDKPWWEDGINRITYDTKYNVKQANLISRLAYFVI